MAKPRGKPFKSGEDDRRGKGRPRKPDFLTIADSLPDAFKDEYFTDPHGQRVSLAQMAVGCVVMKAGEGDMRAVTELCNRVFGKCVEQVVLEQVEKTAGEMTDDELVSAIRSGERATGEA